MRGANPLMTQPGLERILNQERELEDEWNDLTVRAATFRIDRTIRPRGLPDWAKFPPPTLATLDTCGCPSLDPTVVY